MTHDVFISYSSKDKLTADAICSIFETNGIRCWIAPRDILPGMDWGASIIDAINDSQVMVLILSSNSNASEQVKREVERAVHKSIIIIPFRIEDVQLSKSLEYQLSLTHWMDAITPPLETHIQLLVDEIRPLLRAKHPDSSENTILAKPKSTLILENKTPQDNLNAIETYFYDLAKEKRISKDILLAVLALLDKDLSQLSELEQQQYQLINDLFARKFDALNFVRKWDKLSYQIEQAEKTAQHEKPQTTRISLTKPAKASSTQTNKPEEKVTQQDDTGQEKLKKNYLNAIIVFSSIAILLLIAAIIWKTTEDKTPDLGDITPVATTPIKIEPAKNPSIEMVDIKGGCFAMGSPDTETGRYANEKQHQVCVQDFQIDKHEVTQALWQSVMNNNPAKFKGDNLPVEQISWDDVQLFLSRLNQKTGENYRLPTEAEWEYATRAGTTSMFYTGTCIDTNKANYDGTAEDYTNCGAKNGVRVGQTKAVGSYPANPWGLYDMAGNVWEWLCSEYIENYSGHETQCTNSTINNLRVVRGGAWGYGPNGVRPAIRWWYAKNEYSEYIGLRLAKGNNVTTTAADAVALKTTTTATTTANTPLWGSLAVSNKGKYGYSYNYPTSEEADARALKECGSDCYIVKNFNGGCGAYAADQKPKGAWGWGTAPTKERAQELALSYCKQYGGKNCVVKIWSCNAR